MTNPEQKVAKGFKLFVSGTAQSQGSMTAFNGFITSANKKLKPWRKIMTKAFAAHKAQVRWEPLDGPCKLSVCFVMPSNKTVVKEKRFWAHKAFDLDKLTRAVNDSLQEAQVFTNDSRVCILTAYKKHSEASTETPGVFVTITPIEGTDVPKYITY